MGFLADLSFVKSGFDSPKITHAWIARRALVQWYSTRLLRAELEGKRSAGQQARTIYTSQTIVPVVFGLKPGFELKIKSFMADLVMPISTLSMARPKSAIGDRSRATVRQ